MSDEMSRDKQIEEIALKMASESRTCVFHGECKDCIYYLTDSCKLVRCAKKFVEKGYRKATEVAREIFEELKKVMIDEYRYPIIAELKKKYEGKQNG